MSEKGESHLSTAELKLSELVGRLSVEDGVASRDEGTAAVASVPPEVVGLSPVRSSPGLNLDGGHHEDDGKDSQKHQQLEHLGDAEHTWNESRIWNIREKGDPIYYHGLGCVRLGQPFNAKVVNGCIPSLKWQETVFWGGSNKFINKLKDFS